MRLLINETIPIRKRLTKVQKANLATFSIYHNNKHISIQKCTVPEDTMQELIDVIQDVSKISQIVHWYDGSLFIGE